MIRFLRTLLVIVLASQQVLASIPTYYMTFSHMGTTSAGAPIGIYTTQLVGSPATQPGQTVALIIGDQVYRGTYDGQTQTAEGEVPTVRPQEFLGHAKTREGAQELVQEGYSLDTGAGADPGTGASSSADPGTGTNSSAGSGPSGGPNLGSPLDGFGAGVADIGMRGLESGVIAGVSVAISRGLIYTDSVQQYFNDRQAEINASQERVNESQVRVNAATTQAFQEYYGFAKNIGEMTKNPLLNGSAIQATNGRPTNFKTKNEKFLKELVDTTRVLDSSTGETAKQRTAQKLGYKFVSEADDAYSTGQFSDAYAFRNYALAAADLAVGWDPVTGITRSIYEAFTGLNMITGETLTLTEQSFAVLGIVTAGYGNKVGQGLKAITKFLSKSNFSAKVLKAVGRAEHLVKNSFVTKAFRERELGKYFERLREVDRPAFDELRKHFEANPEKQEKYLSLLKDRENIKVDYWTKGDQVTAYTQEKSVAALKELEKVLEPDSVLVRYGGDDWTTAEKLVHIKKTGEMPGYSTRVNINNTNVKEAPVHWTRLEKTEDLDKVADSFGMYSKGDAFEEYAKLNPGAKVITRTAGAGKYSDDLTNQIVKTSGGRIEVVVAPGGAGTFKFVIKK